MKVRLSAYDSKMPNIAIMKISTFHKQNNNNVDWHNPLLDKGCDLLYISKLFDFTPNYQYARAKEIIIGGTGFDIKSKLPKEIDSIRDIDYSLYPNCEYSMQFFSRGCIRNCPFCVVRQKEGYIKPDDPMSLNPKGKWIEILDNNFFANPEWRSAINYLLKKNQPVNFHGVDARIMNEEQIYYLNKLKHHKQIHIAWDNPKDKMLPILKKIIKQIKSYKLMCYVLIGYWSTPEEDYYRVMKLKELGIDPFVMPYNKKDKYQKDFSRWVNHKAVFKSVEWSDYQRSVG